MSIWSNPPIFMNKAPYVEYTFGHEQYKDQLDKLTSALLIEDYRPDVPIMVSPVSVELISYNYTFPKDSLISGSFIVNQVLKQMIATEIGYDDIDIYVKSKEDAIKFVELNGFSGVPTAELHNPMCLYVIAPTREKINVIYGIEYDSPGDLISRFDIRARSMALDPNESKLYTVGGAIEDALQRRISFNPVPRAVTLRRIVKYINKGFSIDAQQGVFFSELVKSNIYSAELELMTKGY